MEFIERQNPWWFIKDWEESDRELSEWRSQKLRWIPSWIRKISSRPFSLNFVYGPRQIGKTTGIKLLIRKLIRGEKVSPDRIAFVSLDFVASTSELREMMNWLVKKLEKRSYIFLDEVTSVDDWWKVVKFFIDMGDLAGSVITVTGSSSLGIVKAPERFPGRMGKGRTIKVLPLTFPELVKVLGYEPGELRVDRKALDELWDGYLVHGGFPKAINGNPDAKESLIQGIASETYKHGKSLRILQDVISSILDKVPSAFSYNSIAGDLGISHNTVREYVEFLQDLLLFEIAYLKVGERVVKRKEKKVFALDPFVLSTTSTWTGKRFLESALYEGIVQSHLLVKFGEVCYYKNSFEIDAISGGLRVEVKAGKPHRKYPKNVLVLAERDIPAFLIDLWLGK